MDLGTKVRTIASTVAQINMCLCMFGITNFENITEDMIYTALTVVATIITTVVGHYKNNDFSEEAAEGTGHTRLLKAAKKNQKVQGENFFDTVEEVEADA